MVRTKYRAKPVVIDGIRFDSRKEGERYIYLKELEKAGEIENLALQVPFLLINSQYIDKKCVERAVKYKADFVYTKDGETVVEDTKGYRTADYIIKRKLMLERYGIRIREI